MGSGTSMIRMKCVTWIYTDDGRVGVDVLGLRVDGGWERVSVDEWDKLVLPGRVPVPQRRE